MEGIHTFSGWRMVQSFREWVHPMLSNLESAPCIGQTWRGWIFSSSASKTRKLCVIGSPDIPFSGDSDFVLGGYTRDSLLMAGVCFFCCCFFWGVKIGKWSWPVELLYQVLLGELERTQTWTMKHVSDHSGFHYRQFLLSSISQHAARLHIQYAKSVSNLVDAEHNFICDLVQAFPSHEALWCHR